MCLVVFLMP
uniref:Uncharacterized protein n=1 Tax=Rhizophora mucronata TaxID=61149 RepID=A0A2P2NEF8_RHIMU